VPDFALDYETLLALQRGMKAMADKAEKASQEESTETFDVLGTGSQSDMKAVFGFQNAARSFDTFYRVSRQRTNEGADRLRDFANMFEGVANAVFQQDSMIAANAAASAAGLHANQWKNEWQAYRDWQKQKEAWDAYLEEIGAADYFREHPDATMAEVCAQDDRPGFCDTWEQDQENYQKWLEDIGAADYLREHPGADIATVCSADNPPEWCAHIGDDPPRKPPMQPPVGDDAPPKPESDSPPTHVQWKDDDGRTTDITVTYDDDFNVTKEVTKITAAGGETITSVREFTYDDNGRVTEETTTVTSPTGEETTTTTEYSGPVTRIDPPDTDPDHPAWPFTVQDYTSTSEGPDGSRVVEEVTYDHTTGLGQKTVTETTVNDDGEEEVTTTHYHQDEPNGDWIEDK
jgi:hypothetical protein